MKMSNIHVAVALDIKPHFYADTVKDIKKVMKSKSFNFRKVRVEDNYDETQNIVVVIQHGTLITYGCDDGKPWTEAYDTPKLFEKMASIGFIPSYFQVDKLQPDERIYVDEKDCLNIGFIKKVPKSQAIKRK